MSIVRRLAVLIAATHWWDKLSPQQQHAYMQAHPYSRIKLHATHSKSQIFDIIDPESEENLGNVSLSPQGHPFIDLVKLKTPHKGKGLAKHIYNAVQQRLKRPLVPNPLGVSTDATRVWQKRLAKLPPEQANHILNDSYRAGLSYGIKPQHITDRLQPLLPNWRPE